MDRRAFMTALLALTAGLAGSLSPAMAAGLVEGADGRIRAEELTWPERVVGVVEAAVNWSEAERWIDATARAVRMALEAAGATVTGAPLVEYDDSASAADQVQIRVMLPIARDPGVAVGGGVEIAALPGGQVLRFEHRGGFGELETAYERIDEYLAAKGFDPTRSYEELVTPLIGLPGESVRIGIYMVQ